MPHRTKKQKIASTIRLQKVAVTRSEGSKPTAESSSATVFKNDFRKSLVIIAVITALEIITYFGTMYYHSQ